MEIQRENKKPEGEGQKNAVAPRVVKRICYRLGCFEPATHVRDLGQEKRFWCKDHATGGTVSIRESEFLKRFKQTVLGV